MRVRRRICDRREWRNAAEVRRKLDELGYTIGVTPERFAAMIVDGIERYRAIIKMAGIQPA
jgi:hypothetical protein